MVPGDSLLHYRVVDKIGIGGMGEVWRATDSTLGRDVAIEILPAEFASDPERLARFRARVPNVRGRSWPTDFGLTATSAP